MRSTPWRFAAAVLSLWLAGCGGGGGTPTTGTLEARLRDTPVEAADAVFVTIERVEILRLVDGVETKETVASTPAQFDLLTLQGGVEAVLGGGEFPPGDYHWIRLIVAKDSPEDIATLPADALKNYIVVEGEAHPLVVPSGAQTGIKLGHDFTIQAGGLTVLTFDFDVRKSVVKAGKKDLYHLKPHIEVVANQGEATADLSGAVTTTDGTALPAGTVVSAQQDGVEVASVAVDPAGAYSFVGLPDGTYDLVLIAPGYAFDSELDVVVVGGDGGGAHDFQTAAAETGSIYGDVSPPGPGIPVRLYWQGFLVAHMDSDPTTGEYLFDVVPVGDYMVEAESGGVSATSGVGVAPGVATGVSFLF